MCFFILIVNFCSYAAWKVSLLHSVVTQGYPKTSRLVNSSNLSSFFIIINYRLMTDSDKFHLDADFATGFGDECWKISESVTSALADVNLQSCNSSISTPWDLYIFRHVKGCCTAFIPLQLTTESDIKTAQLSLGNTRYSLFGSCYSTDLQGQSRSMIFISLEMACAIS